jgi:hypothetical protein
VVAALARVRARSTVIAVDSDRLYPPPQQGELATLLPGSPTLQVVHSLHGHDGFLVEAEQVGELIVEALEAVPAEQPHGIARDGTRPRQASEVARRRGRSPLLRTRVASLAPD